MRANKNIRARNRMRANKKVRTQKSERETERERIKKSELHDHFRFHSRSDFLVPGSRLELPTSGL